MLKKSKILFSLLFILTLFANDSAIADSLSNVSNDSSNIINNQSNSDVPAARKPAIKLSKELISPYHSIKNFNTNLSSESNNPDLASRSLKFENSITKKLKIKLTQKLKRFFDGSGLILEASNFPREINHLDSSSYTHTFVPFTKYPEIYLEKYGDKWQFSIETVSAIEGLHDELYPVAITEFTTSLPAIFNVELLGIHIWQYAGLILYLIIGTLLFYLLSFITGIVIIWIVQKFHKSFIAGDFVKAAAKPASILFVSMMLIKFLPILELPFSFNLAVLYFLRIFIPINVVYILLKFIDLLSSILTKFAERTSNTVDDHLVPFIRKALKGIAIILGGFYILQIFKIDITPLIAGASIGGLAFALAAQDTVKNIFGSFTIFTDQPFVVGDWIVFKDGEGMVEEVGTRSSRIRTFANSLITIPNGRLGDMTIDNMGRRKIRRFSTNIAVTYNTPTDRIDQFILGIRDIVDNHPQTTKDNYHVYLNSFGDFSLNILLYLFFDVPDWAAELKARHEVMIAIIKLAEELGVSFAFPTQTLLVDQFPELKLKEKED